MDSEHSNQQTPPIASGSIPFPVVFPAENVLIVRTPAKVLPRLHIPAPSTTRLARVVVDHVLPDTTPIFGGTEKNCRPNRKFL